MSAEIHDDARAIASDIVEWRATGEEWAEITRLLDIAITAWEVGDWPALRAATMALEEASPLRATRMGDLSRGAAPIPDPVRERVNRLVHGSADRLAEPPPPSR